MISSYYPVLIFIISFGTRYFNLKHPNAVVFDELHYIKFITLYLRRIFFFDPQPPLGKQLMTLAAYLIGFKGDLEYTQIGDLYKPDVPIHALRLLPCLAGSLIAPTVYLVGRELNFRPTIAALASAFVILENSLLTQSRFLLLDPILILLSTLSFYCYLKFRKQHSTKWLIFASVTSALALSTKYSGFYSYALLFGLVVYSWWQSLGVSGYKKLVQQTLLYLICTIVLPLIIYISIYYVHLLWLTKAGPHDTIMTSAFQASLEDGLASITRGQPLEIVHGSQVTLRHTHGRSCWLHSHEHLYPIKYSDGRGSSHQQQVTCYSFKDVNNWWIVKRPLVDELVVTEPYDRIKDGDLVQLVHGLTGRALNSHDVAAAMSPYSQEVSCYVDHNISMPAQNVWQVRLSNPIDTNSYWHTINSRVQLIHLNSSLALRFSGRQLPDWGFHQHEIVADRELMNEDTIWNVEEHRHTKSEDQRERELQFGQAEFVPLEPTSLTFLEKLYELHLKLLTYQQDAIKDHIYASESPLDWLFLTKGTAYWINSSSNDNAQIFLIGNTSISFLGRASIMLFIIVITFYLLRRQRKIYTDINEHQWENLKFQAITLLGGYSCHLIPYFLYESPLFLQYYLNALIFKILIIGAFLEHTHQLIAKKHIQNGILILAAAKALDSYIKLLPLSYGSSLTREGVENLRWKETWQLLTIN